MTRVQGIYNRMVSELPKLLTAMGSMILESYSYRGGLQLVLVYLVGNHQNGAKIRVCQNT